MPKNTSKSGSFMPIGQNSAAVHQQRFADGGSLSHPMEHKRSESQHAGTQPLTGSALKALVRGWAAGTAGLPGDLEGLARAGLHMGAAPGSWFAKNVSRDPALPTSEFYKDWLPGKQQGDEVLNILGSITGGVGATKPISLAKGALSRVAAATPGPMAGARAAQRGVIKAPGGNWLTDSVEDALKGLKTGVIDEAASRRLMGNAFTDARMADPSAAALNNFVDKQLTRYVKNDMATERDPIRALAEKGILHYAPDPLPRRNLGAAREAAGFPATNMGRADLAKTWENVSDEKVRMNLAQELQDPKEFGPFSTAGTLRENPWLVTAGPDVPVHSFSRLREVPGDLGFDHLMDELRNATNINSGLPAHLRLDPASLPQVSVPQAVERVSKINAWREAQKIEANQARANNAATVLHKDYPDNNPRGLRWVELKHSGEDAPFQDSVKYEGETMGHSVGGYANEGHYGVGGLQAARDGRVQLYSLRDAKGQPHVTVEVNPNGGPDPEHFIDRASSDVYRAHPQLDDESDEFADLVADRAHALKQEWQAAQSAGSVPASILQIKGKGNKKPNDEYLPFVQDFVKSGKWSDVGDFGNTGLIRRSALTPAEQAALQADQSYLSMEELQKLREGKPWAPIDNTPEFAEGGSVRNVINAAVGSSNLAKQVGSSADAVRSIAAGDASMNDLSSLRQMASSLGYNSPGLAQAMGLAGAAKAGHNVAKDPTGMNAAKFASTVNPLAAQALSLYNLATNATPESAINAIVGLHPMARAYNALADSFDFANIGRLFGNVDKIGNPEAPAQVRDLFSNNANSDSLARTANDISESTGVDSMDALMGITGAFGTEPGYTGYYSGDPVSTPSSGGFSMGSHSLGG